MNIYQENILDHYRNPRHYGTVAKPSFTIDEHNPFCGDQLHFEGRVEDGELKELTFQGGGCAISLAAASLLAEYANGKSIEELDNFSDAEMLEHLGVPLSPTRTKCGLLAISGVRKGLKQYTEADVLHPNSH